ncbi:hypothetical protein [Streptomyces sp. NPDC016845]|uniref:hypothetical protein n=1 Tax=Streptomyces sp. NPDC016845 TaxID=3364972 RepID=UPI0037984520
MTHIRRQLLFAAVTPLAIGVAAPAAGAVPRPPAATHHQAADTTRTATVVTELNARETVVGSAATLRVKGRLVEGDTMLFPLARLAVSVEVSGDARTAPQKCNTTTTREGRFTCTFHVTPHQMTVAAVTFGGNALFAPGKATTSIPASAPAAPAASAAPSATPSATPAQTDSKTTAQAASKAPTAGAATRPLPLPAVTASGH